MSRSLCLLLLLGCAGLAAANRELLHAKSECAGLVVQCPPFAQLLG